MTEEVRILLVDDEELVLRSMEKTLLRAGFDVETAGNVMAGLTLFREALDTGEPFDVAILDLNMPGTDGSEILREMRGVKHRLPVVIITGYPDSEMMDRAMKQGPLGVLLKPFDDSDIINAVNSFLHATKAVR